MKNAVRWTLLFGIIFALSMGLWWWGPSDALGPFGFPWWVYYFAGLQLVLAIAIYRFAQHYWPTDDEDA